MGEFHGRKMKRTYPTTTINALQIVLSREERKEGVVPYRGALNLFRSRTTEKPRGTDQKN
jgi:hypothetical protein